MEPLGFGDIVIRILAQFLPVWISLVVLFVLSFAYKRRLGLYGKLFDSPIGMVGFALVMFWVFTGIYAGFDMIATHDPLAQLSGMKNKLPGTPLSDAPDGVLPWYLLGGDNLARDVFSRMVHGATIVIAIAPLATLFAFMVGITLGLPAGYYGGRLDTFLSFLANLILAFPVILLFYLLVTPEIVLTGLPQFMAAVLFFFPLIFSSIRRVVNVGIIDLSCLGQSPAGCIAMDVFGELSGINCQQLKHCPSTRGQPPLESQQRGIFGQFQRRG